MSQENIIDVDAVFNTPVDMEEVEQIVRDSQVGRELLAEGKYYTLPALELKIQSNYDGDRAIAHYFGSVVSSNGDGGGKVGFDFSPEKRMTTNKKGEVVPDSITKLTAQAAKVFKTVNGQAPENYGELFEFIRTTSTLLYVGKRGEGSFTKDDGTVINYGAKNVVYSISVAE